DGAGEDLLGRVLEEVEAEVAALAAADAGDDDVELDLLDAGDAQGVDDGEAHALGDGLDDRDVLGALDVAVEDDAGGGVGDGGDVGQGDGLAELALEILDVGLDLDLALLAGTIDVLEGKAGDAGGLPDQDDGGRVGLDGADGQQPLLGV